MGLPSIIILMFSVVTTGKTTFMNNSKKVCNAIIDEHIDRMHELCDDRRVKDAESVYSEIRDWVIQKKTLMFSL